MEAASPWLKPILIVMLNTGIRSNGGFFNYPHFVVFNEIMIASPPPQTLNFLNDVLYNFGR